jgi:hypothetical protein
MRFVPIVVVAALAGSAQADPGVATHALVVGSNAAGPGQVELRYAEDDARRVGAILTELGGYAKSSVDVLVKPTPASLRDRLARLEKRVAADTAAGKQVRVFFYYSGHARATAIDLGPEAMPLAELRQRLLAVPATLKVVVLDACQSGAFSRVQGASPTADFSFNSRQQLDATGIAVLASSSGSELSQESEQLKSSYFTHHLLVGMRGAGDVNRDGQVSVDEAYRYAYHQTLLATAGTAVGGQHVTLEVDLKGHGEVPLSFPRVATAAIELPAALEGHALVHDKRAKAVIAETHKAKGAAVRIAVAPGDYEVLVRQGNRLRRCQLVAPGTVDLERCTNEAVVEGTKKSGFLPHWRVELSASVGKESSDEFVQTLSDFGYLERGTSSGLGLAVSRELWRTPRASALVGGVLQVGSSPEWTRETELAPLTFKWRTTTIAALARGEVGLTTRTFAFADATLGLAIGDARFSDQDSMTSNDRFVGFSTSVAGGLGLRDLFVRGSDLTLGLRWTRAPVIDNDLDQTHDSGGVFVGIAAGYRFGGTP